MIGALNYEWLRIRTIASSYWMSGLAIALSAAVTLVMALAVSTNNVDDIAPSEVTTWVLTSGASWAITPVLGAVFYAVIGAMAMGHEYRYGTNKATLSALPDRIMVVLAKLLVLTAWVTGTIVVTLLLNALVAWLFMDSPTFTSDAIRPVVAYWSYCIGFTFAGFGLAAILRNLTGAIVAVLVWPLVLEPIVNGITTGVGEATDSGLGKLSNILPATAGRRTMFDPYSLFAGFGEFPTWGLAASFVVFWVGVLGLLVAGTVLFVTRDA